MSKKEDIAELIGALTNSLTHEIGSIVNRKSIYSDKYRKEAINFKDIAKSIVMKINFNHEDKVILKETLEKRVMNELIKRSFLEKEKFDLIENKVKEILEELQIWVD